MHFKFWLWGLMLIPQPPSIYEIWKHKFYSFHDFSQFKFWLWGLMLPPKPPSNEKSEITASSPSNIFAVWILTLRINANTPTYIKSRIWYHNFYSFQHFSKFKYWLWGLTPIPQPPSNLKSETTTPFNTFCSSNFDLRHTSYLSRTPRILSVENFWSCGEISDIKKF